VSGRLDRPTVVIGGSVGSTLATWEAVLAALAVEFHVIAYDHRGHGGSPAPVGPYIIDDLAQDVLALLDEYQVARAHVVGLSLGGMVAQLIAARRPHRVDRLVLLCTAAHYPDPRPWRERAAIVRLRGTEAIADEALDRWLTADYRSGHPEETVRLRKMIAGIDREGYAGCCEAIADMDLRPDLSRIQAATLVLAGAEDPALPTEQMRELAAAISGSQFVIVAGAHVPTIEHPDIVTRLLLEHLGAGTA
jgi:3-oxoadipate enol-lactonase